MYNRSIRYMNSIKSMIKKQYLLFLVILRYVGIYQARKARLGFILILIMAKQRQGKLVWVYLVQTGG